MAEQASGSGLPSPLDIEKIRRVVTGLDAAGRSTVAYEDFGPNIRGVTDTIRISELWTTPTSAAVPDGGDVPFALVPSPGGTLIRLCEMAPKPLGIGTDADGTPDGLHATPTVDYVVVLSGRLTLTLEDGTSRVLSPGDVAIQRGTPHAWSVDGDEPCVFLAVIVDDPSAPQH
jgi:mannose-6-phosphate isomerase-like protein (cupin superfamily)